MSSTAIERISNETGSTRKVSTGPKYMRDFRSNERNPIQIVFDPKRKKPGPRRWKRLPQYGNGHLRMELHQQRSERLALTRNICGTSKRTNESPSILFRSKTDKTWSAAVGKTSPDSSMIVKSWKRVRKLNKPLKASKICKETQRDAKRRKEKKNNGTEREGAERTGHHRGSATTQWYIKRSEGIARPVKVSQCQSEVHND